MDSGREGMPMTIHSSLKRLKQTELKGRKVYFAFTDLEGNDKLNTAVQRTHQNTVNYVIMNNKRPNTFVTRGYKHRGI